MAVVTSVLAEQSGIGARLLAESTYLPPPHSTGLAVKPTERSMSLIPKKKLPQLQADTSSAFSVEVKSGFSWVPDVWERGGGPTILRTLVFLGSIICTN
jgi:hypothetical protein